MKLTRPPVEIYETGAGDILLHAIGGTVTYWGGDNTALARECDMVAANPDGADDDAWSLDRQFTWDEHEFLPPIGVWIDGWLFLRAGAVLGSAGKGYLVHFVYS